MGAREAVAVAAAAMACCLAILLTSNTHLHACISLCQHFIINAPFIFSAIWRVVRGWLDPVTAQKIQILGSNYQETLLAEIAPEQLPVEYGGTNPFVLESPRVEEAEGRRFVTAFDAARAVVMETTGCGAEWYAAEAVVAGAGASGADGGGGAAAAPPDPPGART